MNKSQVNAEIFKKAMKAGAEAVEGLDEKTDWYPCGFAWVNVTPGTSSFARWLTKNGHGRRDSYYGGITIWCPLMTQKMVVKEAWARAVSNSLQAQGITAGMMSRID